MPRDLVGYIKNKGHAIFSFFNKGKLCAHFHATQNIAVDNQCDHYYMVNMYSSVCSSRSLLFHLFVDVHTLRPNLPLASRNQMTLIF